MFCKWHFGESQFHFQRLPRLFVDVFSPPATLQLAAFSAYPLGVEYALRLRYNRVPRLILSDPGDWGRSAKFALWITLAFRIFYSVTAALLSSRLRLDGDAVRANALTENLISQADTWRYALLGVWERFDTLWYIHIAVSGYDRPESSVFPPLFPWLIRLVTFFTGSPLVSALAVSTVSSFFLFYGFHRLVSFDLPESVASRAVIVYATWPASFIFFAGYPDSLTIALMLWALVFARSERWWFAGLAGMLAGLAKAVGGLVALPLLMIAWRKRSWRAAPVLLAGSGYVLYTAWLYSTGRLLPVESYPRYWHTNVALPWETVWSMLRDARAGNWAIQLHLLILAFVVAVTLFKRVRLEYLVFAAAALAFVLSKKSDPSQMQLTRYLLILFMMPLHLVIAGKSRYDFAIEAAVLFPLNLLFFWHYLNWSLIT